MPNKFLTIIAKILLIVFLIILSLAILVTFFKFSAIEKRLKSDDINYSKLLDPRYTTTNSTQETNSDKSQLILGDENNYSLGTEHPKITIVEFADFSCPYCKRSFPQIREISLKYNQDIKYIFRDLPIINVHSIDLALAARCAGEQGLFWPMHDRLFINQGVRERSEILLLAKQSGADLEKFESCFDSQKYLPYIKKDLNDAKLLGIDHIGTPVWFINGQQIEGSIPEDIFNKFIKDILNK